MMGPQKIKVELSYDPVIPLLGVMYKRIEIKISKAYLYTPVHSNIIHNIGGSNLYVHQWLNGCAERDAHL